MATAMAIEFNYAQGHAQARLAERLPPAGWQLLESSGTYAQYLHAARATPLGARIQSLATTASPHAVERTLRNEWRSEVLAATRWVPERWRPAVAWAAWLCDLPMLAWLEQGGEFLPWMANDKELAIFARGDPAIRRRALSAAGAGVLAEGEDMFSAWRQHFERLWPSDNAGTLQLRKFVDVIDDHRSQPVLAGTGGRETRAPGRDLDAHAVRLIRRCLRQPVTVFSHLLLVALDLGRLRDGLVRRSLLGDWSSAA